MSDETLSAIERLLHGGRVAAAVPLLEEALAAMPAGWKPRVDREDRIDIAFWDRKDFIAWVEWAKPAKKVFWIMPSYSRLLYYLGFAAVERQDLDAAEKAIDEGLALEQHSLLLAEKGLILSHRRRREEAMDFYRKAAEAAPWSNGWTARALRGLGFELVELRRLDEAEEVFRRSLELEPGHVVAKNELDVIADLRKGGSAAPSGLTRGGGQDEAQKN